MKTRTSKPTAAPTGDLSSYERYNFARDGFAHAVYRKGAGPAVLVLTEMPNISPQVVGFADRVVGLGCTAVLPDLFGEAGRELLKANRLRTFAYAVRTMARACISKAFTAFALGKSSPVASKTIHTYQRKGFASSSNSSVMASLRWKSHKLIATRTACSGTLTPC